MCKNTDKDLVSMSSQLWITRGQAQQNSPIRSWSRVVVIQAIKIDFKGKLLINVVIGEQRGSSHIRRQQAFQRVERPEDASSKLSWPSVEVDRCSMQTQILVIRKV